MGSSLRSLANILRTGGVAILRTDTIYGIIGRADSEATVERIFHIKGRAPTKSPIVLISNVEDMFDAYDTKTIKMLDGYWPGPNSIILPSVTAPAWIARGNESVAYRLPADATLQALLREVGPLIAPSANPEGLPPATTIEEAREYFGNSVDYYQDDGVITNVDPSALYKYNNGKFTQLR